MMNYTKTVLLEAKLCGPITGRRVSSSLSMRIVESERPKNSAISSIPFAILALQVRSVCMTLRLNSPSSRNGT